MTEAQKQVKIIIDSRELRSPIARELDKLNIDMQFETLPVGDYILSDRCAVERKTVDDFYNSLFIDKKLFGQLHDLKQYEVPILIIEGYEAEMFTARRINGLAVNGILNSIALMRIPIRYTVNPAGTARVMVSMAAKEQNEDKRTVSYHGKRSHLSKPELMEYIISSIPDIGTATAQSLLKHFGTVENVMKAGIGELIECGGIGIPTATKLRAILTEHYK